MSEHKNYIPKVILERRKKNKQITEERKNFPKKSLEEIAEDIRLLNEEVEKMLRENNENK